MFRIKICGVTNVEDAVAVAASGADAVGLNFYSGSPRYVTNDAAAEIADAVRGRVNLVGVFVNHSSDAIRATADKLALDYVQLHGDEPLEMLAALAGLQVIRAFRCGDDGLGQVAEFIHRAGQRKLALAAALIDAHDPRHYGGTGKTTDWIAVRGAKANFGGVPIVLAGGLRAANVSQAIAAAQPEAVDTASGVELSARRKSPAQITKFVDSALAAFGGLT